MYQISKEYLQAVRKKVWKTNGTEWGQTDTKEENYSPLRLQTGRGLIMAMILQLMYINVHI